MQPITTVLTIFIGDHKGIIPIEFRSFLLITPVVSGLCPIQIQSVTRNMANATKPGFQHQIGL